MTILRVGSTPKYAANWNKVFSAGAKKKTKPAKASAKTKKTKSKKS